MSRYSYEGSPHEATAAWRVASAVEDGAEYYFIEVPRPCDCGCPKCKGVVYRPHTNGMRFEEASDAHEWMEGVQEFLDNDYEQYAEENSYAIAQMERYEQFRNEY